MGIGNMVSGGLAYKGTQNALKQQKAAAEDLTKRMEVAQKDVQFRRPQAQQERETALRNQLSLLGPANSLVGEMGGGGGKYSLNLGPEMSKSPVSMKPLLSQLGPTVNGGGYDTRRVADLRDAGYDVSGINYGPIPKPAAPPPHEQGSRENIGRRTVVGTQRTKKGG